MISDDLTGVLLVADQVHPDKIEDAHVIAERLSLFPEGCYVLLDESEQVVGYAIAHPIASGKPPKLNKTLGALPNGLRDFYLHDLAILPSQRGGGYARQIIERLVRVGRRYQSICLVSAHDRLGFWQKFGFCLSTRVSGQNLAAYGEEAVFMEYDERRMIRSAA